MIFDLSDEELDQLWILQRDATVLLSVSATSMFLSLGLWFENAARDVEPEGTPPRADFLFDVGMPLLLMVAVLLAVMGFFALKRRRDVLAAIHARRRMAEAEVTRLEDSADPGIVASAREPSRSLLRW